MATLRVVNTGSKAGNSYVLECGNEKLLLDAGAKFKDTVKALDYNVMNLSGILLTHEHSDHIRCYEDFGGYGIPVYGSPELGNRIEGVTEVLEKKMFRVGSFRVVAFNVPHTTRSQITGDIVDCPNYAYLIFLPNEEKLLYATDFEYLPVTLKTFVVEHWLIECNHIDEIVNHDTGKYEHVMKGHSSLSTVKGILAENHHENMKNIVLCHLSDENSDEERMLREVREVVPNANVLVAEKGLEVHL